MIETTGKGKEEEEEEEEEEEVERKRRRSQFWVHGRADCESGNSRHQHRVV